MKYQLVKNDFSGLLENFIDNSMLRNKYKYGKNYGLLPTPKKNYKSPVNFIAILGENVGREYTLCLNPNNKKMLILFN